MATPKKKGAPRRAISPDEKLGVGKPEAKPAQLDTVKLGKDQIKLRAPHEQLVLYEVWIASAASGPRAYVAALGLCLPGPHKVGARYNGDVQAYGMAVSQELLGRGLTIGQITAAGLAAWSLCTSKLKLAPELQEAGISANEGFIARSEEG